MDLAAKNKQAAADLQTQTFESQKNIMTASFAELKHHLGDLEEKVLTPLVNWFNTSGIIEAGGRVIDAMAKLPIAESLSNIGKFFGDIGDDIKKIVATPEYKEMVAAYSKEFAALLENAKALIPIFQDLKGPMEVIGKIAFTAIAASVDAFATALNLLKPILDGIAGVIHGLAKTISLDIKPTDVAAIKSDTIHRAERGAMPAASREEAERQQAAEKQRTDALLHGNTAQDAATEGLQKVDKAATKLAGNDLHHLDLAVSSSTDALAAFQVAMAQVAQNISSLQFGMGGAGAGMGTGGEGTPGAGGPIRAEAYGPGVDKPTHDTLYGPTGAPLTQGGYAVSPDLSAGHRLGEHFTFQDSAGKTITGQYQDASYRTTGVPNHNTIEQWGGKDLGHVSNLQWEGGQKGASAGAVGHTFNINIHAIDSASFASTVADHAEVIADHVKHVLELDRERQAFV